MLRAVPTASLTRGALAAATEAGAIDSWSASVRVLDPALRDAATRLGKGPLAVWTVDTEPMLRRAFVYGADDVVIDRVGHGKCCRLGDENATG